MTPLQSHCIWRTTLKIGLLLTVAGCSTRQPDQASLVDAVAKAVGFALPPDAAILAYHHQHGRKGDSQCSQLWIVRASVPFAGPDRQTKPNYTKAPFKSLQLLVEQATDGRVTIEAADKTACQCAEWQRGESLCRLRQSKTRDGWVAALEVVAPE